MAKKLERRMELKSIPKVLARIFEMERTFFVKYFHLIFGTVVENQLLGKYIINYMQKYLVYGVKTLD